MTKFETGTGCSFFNLGLTFRFDFIDFGSDFVVVAMEEEAEGRLFASGGMLDDEGGEKGLCLDCQVKQRACMIGPCQAET
jgi:hypothetical protein